MVFSKQYSPHPALQSFVRYYHIIHVQFDPKNTQARLPVKPYPPTTEQCLYFYPYDLPHSVKAGNKAPEHAVTGMVVGQPLTRMNITINANYLMLKVSFQPGSLFRLLSVPMTLFTDGYAELETITGKTLREAQNARLQGIYPAHTKSVCPLRKPRHRLLRDRFKPQRQR